MALRCAICGTEENVKAVCHHCGKPLCETHLFRYERDRAFVTPWYKVRWYQLLLLPIRLLKRLWPWRKRAEPVIAIHCLACSNQYHPWP